MTKSRCLTISAIVFIGIVTSMWLMRSDPVLFVWMEEGPLLPGNLVFIQNPFRDRGPERAADRFFNDLKLNEFSTAFQFLESSPEILSETIVLESEFRIVSWTLNQRSDSMHQATLEFWVDRGHAAGGETHMSPVWLELKQTQDGWLVVDYETDY